MRCAVTLCLVLASTLAFAGEPVDPAKQKSADVLFEKGQALYQAGQFQAAIPLFQEAFDLVHDPVYLFNIGQSYRKVLDCEKASEFYARYLAAATDADAKQREKVQGWIRELAPCVDQRQQDREAVKRAEALARERQQGGGGAPIPARTEVVDRGRPLRIGGIAFAGVGVLGLGVGTAFMLRGRSLRRDVDSACKVGCGWDDPEIQDKDAAGRRANTFAAIGWIGGGAAILTGAALYWWGTKKAETITVSPSATGATVSARFTF